MSPTADALKPGSASAGTPPTAGASTPSLRPRAGVLLSLLAGRTAFRLALLGANAALLASWGEGPYEHYARAMGTAQVLTTITSLGIEKCALKLVPRARRTGPQLITVFLAAALLLASAAAIWLGCATLYVSDGHHLGVLGPLAGLYAALLGLNMVLVGLCRALGRNRADVVNFAVLSVIVLTGAGGAALLEWGPVAFTGWLLGGTALLNLAQLPALHRAASRPVRRDLARQAVATSLLMAAGDVAASGAVSVLFAVLARSRHHDESGHLYLMVLASSVLLNVFGYVMRLFQPHVSLTLRSADPALLDRRVVGRLLPVALWGTVWTAAAFALTRSAERAAGLEPAVTVLLLYLLCVPLFFAVGSLHYLLENATAGTLRATAVAALAGLGCAAALGLLLVPLLGALGAVTSLAAGEIAHALAAWLLLRGGARPAAPAQGPAAPPERPERPEPVAPHALPHALPLETAAVRAESATDPTRQGVDR
ncbi:hypothetical protein [Streptomyces katsurahamanus]|uniref:hypothetical protein n=1 Tax=Streptomyces katsurahamanus TaxID=2577098 RepID=UPI001294D81E|nr:hypothetical protein [Streptomyces katsurahamanus]